MTPPEMLIRWHLAVPLEQWDESRLRDIEVQGVRDVLEAGQGLFVKQLRIVRTPPGRNPEAPPEPGFVTVSMVVKGAEVPA